ncbi:hypothetical protein LWI29_002287 [Acer saccharum]|uniref:Uncharacterized protein n=1 Tax=Acer saccharum TaxID=4024 RepID=A0AA39VXN5_ACESA|nr:hypothetical protein LWI29_002287 [Acer saccharum]
MELNSQSLIGISLWLLLSCSLSYGTVQDIACLESVKNSLKDPYGYLNSSWNFNNDTEGFICKFTRVECLHPDENKGTIKLGPWGGPGGSAWDYDPGSGSSIIEIEIGHGDVVNSLAFKSIISATGKTVLSGKHGGTGGASRTVGDLANKNPERFCKNETIIFRKRLHRFTEFVDAFLVRFGNLKLCMQKFRLLIGLLDVEASSLLDKWIGLAIKNEVKDLDLNVQTYKNAMYTLPWIIFSAASLNALKLEGCKLEHIPEIIRLFSLKSLILKKVAINEEIVKKLTSQCPLLEDFSLDHFWGLKHISVVKPQKLKICSICGPINELKRIELAAPSLQQLAITCGVRGSIIIDVADCSNLKVLKLKGINLIDQEFHRLMSKVPMLEDLKVLSCALIERITISSYRLKKLSVSYCFKLKEIEIDTPNLLSFYYCNHPVLTSIVNAPCPWELYFKNAIDELGNRVDPDAQWFLNMKDFLGVSNQIRSLVIDVRSKRDSFNFEEFRNNLSSLPTEVEKLRVCLDAQPSSFAALLDGLLGICYSRKFYVYIQQELHHNYYEWLCNEMVNIDDNCCNSRNIKCWRHYLKDFKIKGLHFYGPSLNRRPLGVNAVMHLWPKLPNGILECRLDWCFPKSIKGF